VERLGSTIVELGNNFATTEPLITDAAVRASGAANTLGLSTAEMLGFVAQATVVMPRAQSAGSSLTRIWTEMAEAAFEGGTSLDRFAQLMELTTEETAELILNNPADAFLLFVKGTGEAIDAGENWVEILKDIGLNQIRTRELVLNLAGNYPELARAIAESTDEWEANVALIEESERRYASLSSQIQIFRNLIGEINIILGQALAPTIRFVMERLRPFIEVIKDFTERNPQLIAILGVLVAAFGTLAFVVGTALIVAAIIPVLSLISTTAVLVVLGFAAIVTAGGLLLIFWEDLNDQWQTFIGVAGAVSLSLLTIKGILITLPAIIRAVRVAWTLLMIVFSLSNIWLAILSAVVLAFSAFVALSAGLRDLAKQFGGLFLMLLEGKITFEEFWNVTMILFKRLPGAFADAGRSFRNELKELGLYIRNKIMEWLIDLRDWAKKFSMFLRDWLKEFGIKLRNKLKEFGVFLRNWLKELGLKIRDKIKEWAVIVRDELKEFGEGIKNSLRETFDWLITPIIKAWKEIWLTVQFWWPKFVAYVKFYIKLWTFIIKTYIGIWLKIFKVVWPIIWGILTRAFNIIKDIVTTYWDTITTIFKIAWDIIKPIISTAIAIIWNYIVFWFKTLKNIFTLAWNVLGSIIQIYWAIFFAYIQIGILLISGIIRFVMAVIRGDWSAAWNAIKETVVGVWDIIWSTVKRVAGLVWDIIKKFWGFIKNETSTVWTLIKDSVLDALRGIRDTGKAIFNGFITMIENGINLVLGGIARHIQVIEDFLDRVAGV
ncbi:MAG: phage tail tape measure protein, partial [Nitrosopumilus sp.]